MSPLAIAATGNSLTHDRYSLSLMTVMPPIA